MRRLGLLSMVAVTVGAVLPLPAHTSAFTVSRVDAPGMAAVLGDALRGWATPATIAHGALPAALADGDPVANQPAPGLINTAAGQIGASGFAGDGGPGTAALLSGAAGVAFDADGNLYVVDRLNQRVRRVDAATGIIATIAGGGTSAALGDGGAATAAFLNTPQGVAVGPDGDVYIADIGNQKVRRVDVATGIITTVAGSGGVACCTGYTGDGGPATAATLRSPNGIAVDAAGNLYIADTGNHVIRRVDAATDTISTIAGTGTSGTGGDGGPASAANLWSPTDIDVVPGGAIYIADSGSARVRRIDPTTGTITTVAGSGASSPLGDGGPATAAGLIRPSGVVVDRDGDIYVAESGRSRVRRIDAAAGTITTVIGTTTGDCGDGGPSIAACINQPESVAVAANGLIAADSVNRAVFVMPGALPDPVLAASAAFEVATCCTPDRIRVSWTPPATAVNGARVTLSPGGHVITVTAPATSAAFSGLIPGERYTATVRTSNGWGFSTTVSAGAVTFGPGAAFDRFDVAATGPDFTDAYLLAVASKLVYGNPATPGPSASKVFVEAALADLGLLDAVYVDVPTTDTQFAVGSRGDAIVVVFRGTTFGSDIWTDAQAGQAAISTGFGDAWAHSGFWLALVSAYEDLRAAIDAARATRPNAEIVVAGHSLGGALAELAAVRLVDDGYPVAMVHTFGAPNVGGQPLTDLFDVAGLTPLVHRWVNDHDVVPMLLDPVPPYTEIGRTHVFQRGVDAPTVDATTQPLGNGGLVDHDLAVYAENLLRQIADVGLLPAPPAPLTDPINAYDGLDLASMLRQMMIVLGYTADHIADLLVEHGVPVEVAVDVLGFLIQELQPPGLATFMRILRAAYGVTAPFVATVVRDYLGATILGELALALVDEYGLDPAGLASALEEAGFDPADVAAVVASIFDAGAGLLAEGLAALDGQLAGWAPAFAYGGDAALLPTDLAAMFDLPALLESLDLPTVEPTARISEAAEALEAAGWSIDWVQGGAGALAPPTPGDQFQGRTTLTVDALASLTDPITPAAAGVLGGLADALSLHGAGVWDGALTVELVVGVDTEGFYVHPDTTVRLTVDGTVEATGDGPATSIAGAPATVVGDVTADAAVTARPNTTERLRLGAALPAPAMSLAGSVATALVADLGDVDLTWDGTWDLALGPSGSATATLRGGAELGGTATLAFVNPPSEVDLSATWLGDRWAVTGSLPGPVTAAGLTVTGGTLDAELVSGAFNGTATLDVELPIAGSAPILGELVVDWSPSGTTLAGTVRLDALVAGTVARFDDITLTFTTTGAGTSIALTSDPDGSIALFPQGATDQLLLLEQPSGALTTDGVLTLAAPRAVGTIAGEIRIEAADVAVTLAVSDPADPQALVSFGDLTGTVPSLGDLSVTFTGLQLMDDGTFRVARVTADPADVTDTLGIAGVLPFAVERVELVFPDPSRLDAFDATVTGHFDFSRLTGLPFTPILTIGDRTVAAAETDATFTFTVRVDAAQRDLRPVDLGPITIGFADLTAGPVTLGAAITLGGYQDGVLVAPGGLSTGQVDGWMSVVADGRGLTGSIDATLTGSLAISQDRSVLDLAATVVVDGTHEDVFEVQDLSLGVSLSIAADGDGVTLEEFAVDDVTVGLLSVALGDLVRLTVRDGALSGGGRTFALAPTPGTDWISIGGTPAQPGAQIELVGDELEGWGGSIGNVALRAVDDGAGGAAIVPMLLPGFYADLTIPTDATLGFPDWLPIRVSRAGLAFPSIDLADLAGAVELTPDLLTGMRVRASAALVATESFPISGAVEGLEVDLGLLAAGEFPVTNLDAVMFGVEPFDVGPMTIGGGLGLGLVDVDADGDGLPDGQVLFGRIFGEFAYSGFGAGVDLVLTQYGPVLAKVSAPTPIPLGTTGLMLAGVRGSIQFGGQGLAPPADPRDLLGDPRYDLGVPITLEVIREAVTGCVADNAGRTGTPGPSWPCFTWNDGGLVTIGATLTSYAAPGVVSADLNGAIDLRFVRDPDNGALVLGPAGLPLPPLLRLAATGTVDVWGIGLADAAVLVAFDDPLAPTLDMAVQMPGISGPIGFLIPVTGDYAAHIGTDGIAAGSIEATRILFQHLADGATHGSEILYDAALDAMTASLAMAMTLLDTSGAPLDRATAERVAPLRPLGAALLDLDGSGAVEPDEQRTIDRQFLLERLLGGGGFEPLLPPIDEGAIGELAAIAEPLVPMLGALQAALVGEAQRLVDATPGAFDLGDALASASAADVATYTPAGLAFLDVVGRAALDGLGAGAAAWGAVFDPVLRFEGGIQPVIGGVPFGEPTDRGTFTIGRDQIGFGFSGSVESMLMSFYGGIGVAAGELNKVFGIDDIVAVEGTLALPDVFGAVAAGDPMILDPFAADWDVQLSITTKVAGFTLAQGRGVLVPPAMDPARLREIVCRIDRPDIAPCGGDRIPVNGDGHWDAIESLGGLIVSYQLLAPRVAVDPAGVAVDLRLEPPADWLGWLDLIQHDVATVTDLAQVGRYQIFLPSVQSMVDPTYTADRIWPVATTDLERIGVATVEAALADAARLEDAAYAEAVWDAALLGLPVSRGTISIDDDAFMLEAAFPMFGDVPLIVHFGGTEVAPVSDPAATTWLPVPGLDVAVTGADAAALLGAWGLPPSITVDPTGAARLRMYGPGYDAASADPVLRDGGAELTATLDLAGLAEDLEFAVSIDGADPANAEFHASATAARLGPFAGITITDAAVLLDRVGGQWSLQVDGAASTPFGAATVSGTFAPDLTGTLEVALDDGSLGLGGFQVDVVYVLTSTRDRAGDLHFEAVLTGRIDVIALGIDDATAEVVAGRDGVERVLIDVTSATFGPVTLSDATVELQRTAGDGGWQLHVAGTAAVPGVLDELAVTGDLSPDGTGTLSAATVGVLRIGRSGGAPILTLSDASASLVRTTRGTAMSAAGKVGLLGAALGLAGELDVTATGVTGTLTASSPRDGVAFGTATLHGTFSYAVTTRVVVTFEGTATVPGRTSALVVSGTVRANGDGTLTLAATSLTFDGFTLTNGTFTLVRQTTAVGVFTTLGVDAELTLLGQSASVDGSLSAGPARLSGTLALAARDPFAFGGFELAGGFSLEFSALGTRVGVASSLSIPGVDGSLAVTGTLARDQITNAFGQHVAVLAGSLVVAVPEWFPVGGASSALTISGIARLEQLVDDSGALTARLRLSSGKLGWSGVGTFDLPAFDVATDGSLDVSAVGRDLGVGEFTISLPGVDLHVGPAGADTELRIGESSLSIGGITPLVSLPSFDVATDGSFGVPLPSLTELGIGGYVVTSQAAAYRFERSGGVFRLRLAAAGQLAVAGLPAPMALETFELASNGTVTATISARRIGPPALGVRDATITFTRTATNGPTLTITGGSLHLPIGEPISLPTLTFSPTGTLTRTLTRTLALGPGFVASSVPLELTASDGVLTLRQTTNRQLPLLSSTVTLSGFTASSDADFSGTVTGTVKPLGFNLANAIFTISKPKGWVDARLELGEPITVELGPGLFAQVDGWVATNGQFLLSTTVDFSAGNWTNQLDPRAVALNGSASVELRNTGVGGTYSGAICIALAWVDVCSTVDAGIDPDGHLIGTFAFDPPGPDNTFSQQIDIPLFTPVPVLPDTTPPSIAPIDDITVYGEGPVFFDQFVKTSDDRDDTPTVSCSPSSGTTLAVGTHVVTCTVSDDAGNSASRSFDVTVVVLATYSVSVNGTQAAAGGTPTVSPGDVATIVVGRFAPAGTVTGTFHSTPIALGTAVADGDGEMRFAFTVPVAAAGLHHVELTGVGPDGGVVQVVLPVEVAPLAGPTPIPPEASPRLPPTGNDQHAPAHVAFALVIAGALLLAVRRRRPSRVVS